MGVSEPSLQTTGFMSVVSEKAVRRMSKSGGLPVGVGLVTRSDENAPTA